MSNGFQGRSPEQMRLDVVERLRLRRAEALEAVVACKRSSVSDLDGMWDAQLTLSWREVAGASLDSGLLAIEDGEEWSGPIPPIVVMQERCAVRNGIDLPISVARYITIYRPIPMVAVAQAHRAARSGVSLGVVLRRYFVAHGLFVEILAKEVERSGLSSHESALGHLRRTPEALLNHLTATIEEEYNQEREQAACSPEQRRAEIVQTLLAGAPADPIELDELGYEFDACHLGGIATGAKATATLQGLKAGLGRQPLRSTRRRHRTQPPTRPPQSIPRLLHRLTPWHYSSETHSTSNGWLDSTLGSDNGSSGGSR